MGLGALAAELVEAPALAVAGVANIVVPVYDAATHPFTLAAGVTGIVQKSIALDDTKGTLRLRGYCPLVRCDTTASTGNNVVLLTDIGIVGDGTEAAVIISAQVTIDGNAQATLLPRKVVFLPMTARTGAGITDGMFDGINGFGTVLSTADVT